MERRKELRKLWGRKNFVFIHCCRNEIQAWIQTHGFREVAMNANHPNVTPSCPSSHAHFYRVLSVDWYAFPTCFGNAEHQHPSPLFVYWSISKVPWYSELSIMNWISGEIHWGLNVLHYCSCWWLCQPCCACLAAACMRSRNSVFGQVSVFIRESTSFSCVASSFCFVLSVYTLSCMWYNPQLSDGSDGDKI